MRSQTAERPPIQFGDTLVSVSLEVADLAATANYFAEQKLAMTHCDEHTIRLSPRDACGAVLEFAGKS